MGRWGTSPAGRPGGRGGVTGAGGVTGGAAESSGTGGSQGARGRGVIGGAGWGGCGCGRCTGAPAGVCAVAGGTTGRSGGSTASKRPVRTGGAVGAGPRGVSLSVNASIDTTSRADAVEAGPGVAVGGPSGGAAALEGAASEGGSPVGRPGCAALRSLSVPPSTDRGAVGWGRTSGSPWDSVRDSARDGAATSSFIGCGSRCCRCGVDPGPDRGTVLGSGTDGVTASEAESNRVSKVSPVRVVGPVSGVDSSYSRFHQSSSAC